MFVFEKDGAGHSTTPNADVTCIVDVGDLNDMPPEWTDYFNTMQITEKTDYVSVLMLFGFITKFPMLFMDIH